MTSHDWKVAGLETPLGIVAGGSLLGKQWQPREIVGFANAAGWVEVKSLSTAVKVCLSESQGFDRAINDNTTAIGSVGIGSHVRNAETYELYEITGRSGDLVLLRDSQGLQEQFPLEARVVTSRDVGMMQINIPATAITTSIETGLYDPTANFAAAFRLYVHRGFQPWVGYTKNVYLRDTYLKRANRGVANWLADLDLAKTPTDDLAGTPYVHKLTTPVVDFEYRVDLLNAALDEVAREVNKTSVPVAEIKQIVAEAKSAAKK